MAVLRDGRRPQARPGLPGRSDRHGRRCSRCRDAGGRQFAGLDAGRHLRDDIYELRVDGDKQAYRLLSATDGRESQVLLALEAFSKKTQKTPPAKLDLAARRLAGWRARGSRR